MQAESAIAESGQSADLVILQQTPDSKSQVASPTVPQQNSKKDEKGQITKSTTPSSKPPVSPLPLKNLDKDSKSVFTKA